MLHLRSPSRLTSPLSHVAADTARRGVRQAREENLGKEAYMLARNRRGRRGGVPHVPRAILAVPWLDDFAAMAASTPPIASPDQRCSCGEDSETRPDPEEELGALLSLRRRLAARWSSSALSSPSGGGWWRGGGLLQRAAPRSPSAGDLPPPADKCVSP